VERDGSKLTAEQTASARSMRVDLVTAEVGRAFEQAGVQAILLKGPSVAKHLYLDGTARPYGDSDLLIAEDQRPAAEAALERLGFQRHLDDRDTPGWHQVAHHWIRQADEAEVDLHWTLTGVAAPPDALWTALAARTEPMRVADFGFEVLDPGGRALHVALHAAQHGAGRPRPLEDLRRALEHFGEPIWKEAARLAQELDALPAFGTGLRLLDEGRELADRLMVPADTSVEADLLATSPPPAAMGIEHLAQAKGGRARAGILLRKLVPTARFMRAWSPLARRGRLGLAAAYLGRPFWLVAQAPRGFLAWRRARKAG
jgi:hypothetical protein